MADQSLEVGLSYNFQVGFFSWKCDPYIFFKQKHHMVRTVLRIRNNKAQLSIYSGINVYCSGSLILEVTIVTTVGIFMMYR